jgi:pimeloyl-ACP methyl ester carboxylesterase
MTTIERDGAVIAYEAVGPDTSGGGRAVVLLHNIFCDRRVFTATVAALRGRYRTIAIDFRGHGESPLPSRRYDVDDLVADVVAVLDRERIERATLVGLSIGTTVALELALAHPARVEGLVLMGADAEAEPTLLSLRNGFFCRLVPLLGIRWFILDAIVTTLFGASFRAAGGEAFADYRARMVTLNPRAAVLAMRAWMGRRGLLERARTITVPARIVVGDEDVSCPLPCGQKLAGALPRAELVRIPRAGHTMTAERPQETTAAITGFLGDA